MLHINRQNSKSHARRGVTLIELLVVVSIMAILVSAAMPVVRFQKEGRKIREAARSVNVFLGAARNRTMETGRPCGVLMKPYLDQPCAAMLEQVEVPPAYGGELMTSAVTVKGLGGGSIQAQGDINDSLISPGDTIQFNHQGPTYTISSASGGTIMASTDVSRGQLLPWTDQPSMPMPFRILRRPIKSVASPLTLVGGAVVDLSGSGIDDGTFGDAAVPVIIMFSPNGSLQSAYIGSETPIPVIRPLHLLIGMFEKTGGADSVAEVPNIADLSSLWVTIHPQTGMVTSNVMAPTDDPLGPRAFAKQSQSMGER